jgi:hypothetical protein
VGFAEIALRDRCLLRKRAAFCQEASCSDPFGGGPPISLGKSLVTPVNAAPRRLGAKLASAAGLLIALAGTLAAPEAVPVASLPSRISVPLPDWLVVAAIASFSTASLIVIAMTRPWRRRIRRPEEDALGEEAAPPWLSALLFLLSLIQAAMLIGAIFWLAQSDFLNALGFGRMMTGDPAAAIGAGEAPRALASPVTTGLIGALALLGGFGSLGFVLWLLFSGRLHQWPKAFKDLHRPLATAVDDSLDALRGETDARIAIIRSYGNFERALASAAFPRRSWETPVEFMRAVLRCLPLPAAAVSRLTALFELARFSQHPIGAEQRDSALRALTEIRQALQRNDPDAAIS